MLICQKTVYNYIVNTQITIQNIVYVSKSWIFKGMHIEGIDAHIQFKQNILLGSYCKNKPNKPKHLCNRTTNCLSVSYCLASHTRNPTAHQICIVVPEHQKAAGTIQARLSGSFSGRLTKELRILFVELKRWSWGLQPAYRQLESNPNKKKKQDIHLKKKENII